MQPDTEREPGKTPGYEPRDVDVRGVLRPALGLAIVTVFAFIAMRWTLDFFEWRRGWLESRSGIVAHEPEPPPEPRLQLSPPAELAAMREEHERLLQSYSWIERKQGIVRIPIERAMDLLAEEGFPVRDGGGG